MASEVENKISGVPAAEKINQISSVKDWQSKEIRLQDIKTLLDEQSKTDNADLEEVINLRDEARELAEQLHNFLHSKFKNFKKNQ
jgi:DNA-binding transcriptional MerR regulator